MANIIKVGEKYINLNSVAFIERSEDNGITLTCSAEKSFLFHKEEAEAILLHLDTISVDALRSYRLAKGGDNVGSFLTECCDIQEGDSGQAVFMPLAILYDEYARWAKRAAVRPKSQRLFSDDLIKRGLVRSKRRYKGFKNSRYGFDGITLKK